jgi:hypothetical protein
MDEIHDTQVTPFDELRGCHRPSGIVKEALFHAGFRSSHFQQSFEATAWTGSNPAREPMRKFVMILGFFLRIINEIHLNTGAYQVGMPGIEATAAPPPEKKPAPARRRRQPILDPARTPPQSFNGNDINAYVSRRGSRNLPPPRDPEPIAGLLPMACRSHGWGAGRPWTIGANPFHCSCWKNEQTSTGEKSKNYQLKRKTENL